MSAAKTNGPHIKAPFDGLSTNVAFHSAFGRTSDTVSPSFHVRFTSIYEPGFELSANNWSFTFISKPSPAQYGLRIASVNSFGVSVVIFMLAPYPSGNDVY